jgi:hypothetical protein
MQPLSKKSRRYNVKQSTNRNKKGGDSMSKQSVPVVVEKPRRGRPDKEDRGSIILSNGLSARQWEWLQREANNKVPAVDAAYLQRLAVQTFIDAVEASRTGPVATPEQDQQFEKLVKSKTTNPKNQTRSNKS